MARSENHIKSPAVSDLFRKPRGFFFQDNAYMMGAPFSSSGVTMPHFTA